MMKCFAFLIALGVLVCSCEKEDPEPTIDENNNNQGLGTSQPVWDGFYLDLYVYDSLGNPMDSVLIENVDLPFNGRQCGNDPFISDSTGYCLVCVMYGRDNNSQPNPPVSQKFALTYQSFSNEIEFEVLVYDTTSFNHYYQF